MASVESKIAGVITPALDVKYDEVFKKYQTLISQCQDIARKHHGVFLTVQKRIAENKIADQKTCASDRKLFSGVVSYCEQELNASFGADRSFSDDENELHNIEAQEAELVALRVATSKNLDALHKSGLLIETDEKRKIINS